MTPGWRGAARTLGCLAGTVSGPGPARVAPQAQSLPDPASAGPSPRQPARASPLVPGPAYVLRLAPLPRPFSAGAIQLEALHCGSRGSRPWHCF